MTERKCCDDKCFYKRALGAHRRSAHLGNQPLICFVASLTLARHCGQCSYTLHTRWVRV